MSMKEQIRNYISENFLFGDSNNLKDDQSFLSTGIIDSTGVLELITFVEDTFNIKIHDEEIVPENLDSIDKLVQFIEHKKNGSTTTVEESLGVFGI